jgi:hypothetical protein
LFWRNSGCSGEQKILGISFLTVPQRRKMLGILYHGTKLCSSKCSEFCSEPFRGRDNKSEFRSEACLGLKHAVNYVCWSRLFCKTNFFMPFPSVPNFGIDTSVNFGMPRNEHFLPRNNRSYSESIPRNFFGTKFRCQPYCVCSLKLEI